MIDLLFVSHNRLEFTRAAFTALAENTNWDLVEHLHVLDDRSTDGSSDFLATATRELHGWNGQELEFTRASFGGPVAAMNRALDDLRTETLVKVDNDFVACPGWLDALLGVLDADPVLDVLGLEAGFGSGLAPVGAPRGFRDARHVGGIGAFRTRIFQRRRPRQHDRFFGLTQFQVDHAECGWLTPDLPCFALDHLPVEPWRSLAADYVTRGWARAWPAYPDSMRDYWAWWTDGEPSHVAMPSSLLDRPAQHDHLDPRPIEMYDE